MTCTSEREVNNGWTGSFKSPHDTTCPAGEGLKRKLLWVTALFAFTRDPCVIFAKVGTHMGRDYCREAMCNLRACVCGSIVTVPTLQPPLVTTEITACCLLARSFFPKQKRCERWDFNDLTIRMIVAGTDVSLMRQVLHHITYTYNASAPSAVDVDRRALHTCCSCTRKYIHPKKLKASFTTNTLFKHGLRITLYSIDFRSKGALWPFRAESEQSISSSAAWLLLSHHCSES